MASAGQAQAHSSQPMHFSSPSGYRLSWWWPWNRGAVGRLSSGYSTVSTFRNISVKVTPNPLIGLRNSSTCDLLRGGVRRAGTGLDADPGIEVYAVVVRQVKRRHRERRPDGPGPVGLGQVRRVPGVGEVRQFRIRPGVPHRPPLRGAVPYPGQDNDEHDDEAED